MANVSTDFSLDVPVDSTFHRMPSEKTRRWESTLPAEYWEYRRKWEQWPKNHIVGSFPIHLDIEATNACNLKCVMCPRSEMVKAGTFWKVQNIDFDMYKRIIDESVENGLCSVKYNYLGEPLLNPRLVEMIEYTKSAGVIDVMFNTNATLLDENMSYRLIESGLDKLFFSFDSPYRDDYNRIRAGADYDTVLDNIRHFVEIREAMGLVKPFTRVSMVRMKDNEGQWEDFQKLFGPIMDAVAYVDYVDHGSQNNPERTIVPIKPKEGRFCCPQLWQRMFIHPDGVVIVCCMDSLRTLQIGNIFEQSVKEIWLSGKYQELRKLHASGRYNEIPMCARCPLTKSYKE